jgi:hypothetical protein
MVMTEDEKWMVMELFWLWHSTDVAYRSAYDDDTEERKANRRAKYEYMESKGLFPAGFSYDNADLMEAW